MEQEQDGWNGKDHVSEEFVMSAQLHHLQSSRMPYVMMRDNV